MIKSQQQNSSDFLWSTIEGECSKDEEAQAAFQRIVSESLNLELKPKNIYPIYDYFHDGKDKINYVFYAEIKTPREFESFKGSAVSWVAFGEISKLLFTEHTKQDVIVGERVINAKWREDEAGKTENS